MLGSVTAIQLGGGAGVEKLKIGSDNGTWDVSLYRIPCRSVLHMANCVNIVRGLLNLEDYDVVFATPRAPVLLAKYLARGKRPVLLRLWSIRAAKLVNNLLLGGYEDLLIFLPSLLANFFYILHSTYIMTLDNVTYTFASKMYYVLANRIIKVYPPYGYVVHPPHRHIAREDGMTRVSKLLEIIDRGGYILGFTVLSKKGVYLKAEAKIQAEALYLIAKKTNTDVVLAGSTLEDWKRVFPHIKPPKNLHIVGRGFGDELLVKLYQKAEIIVLPITFLSISNRFLEALFYGRPIITTSYAKYLHPELIHERHIYITDNVVKDTIRLLKSGHMLKTLEQGAREAYARFFSTKRNIEAIKRLVVI